MTVLDQMVIGQLQMIPRVDICVGWFFKKQQKCITFSGTVAERGGRLEGKSQKKVLLLMARPLRPNPPPPSSLMAVEILERWKKGSNKMLFFP